MTGRYLPAKVILWSSSRQMWEVWREGRPVCESAALEHCQDQHPDAVTLNNQVARDQLAAWEGKP